MLSNVIESSGSGWRWANPASVESRTRNRCTRCPWSGMSGVHCRLGLVHDVSSIARRSTRAPPFVRKVAVACSGWNRPVRYAASTPFHHLRPPRRARARTTVATPIATCERRVRRRSGGTPGSSPLSFTAAPTSVTAPMKRNAVSARRAAPSGLSSARRRVATAMTGTSAVPDPTAPSTVTCTPYDPPVISHSAALYRVESPGTRSATSGGGGAAVRGSQ